MTEDEGREENVRPHLMIKIGDKLFLTSSIKENPITLQREDAVTYETINTRNASKIITTIRRFVCTKDTCKSLSFPDHLRTIHFREGDIIEEIFDNPNIFYNISHMEREGLISICKYDQGHHMEIHTINWENTRQQIRLRSGEIVENTMFENFEPMENIDVKESVIFQMRKRKVMTMLRARMRKAAIINEEINCLNYMLEIEAEEQ